MPKKLTTKLTKLSFRQMLDSNWTTSKGTRFWNFTSIKMLTNGKENCQKTEIFIRRLRFPSDGKSSDPGLASSGFRFRSLPRRDRSSESRKFRKTIRPASVGPEEPSRKSSDQFCRGTPGSWDLLTKEKQCMRQIPKNTATFDAQLIRRSNYGQLWSPRLLLRNTARSLNVNVHRATRQKWNF